MANNPVYVNINLHDPFGPVAGIDLGIGSASSPILTESKILVDDTFESGTVDLAPYLAAIVDAGPILLVVDIENAAGANLNFDGAGATTLAYKRLILQVVPDGSNPIDLELTLSVDSRVRVWCYGDIIPGP